MEPAAARRRPTDVVAGARRAPAARARAAASGTAARGGRRRPSLSLLCRVGSVLAAIFAPRQICLVALSFQALHDGVYPWRLCPRSTKTAVSSTFTACFVRRLVRCAYLLRLPLPQNGPEARGSDSPWAIPTRRLQERPVFYLSWNFEEFWAGSHFRHGFFFSLIVSKLAVQASRKRYGWTESTTVNQ